MNPYLKRVCSVFIAIVLVLNLLPLSLMASALASNIPEPVMVTNPEYEQYLIDLENGDTEKYNGMIPDATPPMSIPEQQGVNTRSTSLPSTYDPRYTEEVTDVKNQGQTGLCWAHAGIASIESYDLRVNGLESDYSENYYNYLTAKNAFGTESNDYAYGYDHNLNDGRPLTTVIDRAMNWYGPVNDGDFLEIVEENIPTISEDQIIKQEVRHVQGYQKIASLPTDATDPIAETENKIQEIKEVIASGCALVSLITIPDETTLYYNATNNAQYLPININPDVATNAGLHAVVIVGWDDTYSKSNFGSVRPSQNGAFIVKNSWGNGWGNEGYFYLSYYDYYIYNTTQYAVTDVQDRDNYSRNYGVGEMYDDGGTYSWQPGTTSIYLANTFEKQAGNEYLGAIGFGAAEYNTPYEIYVNPNGDTIVDDDLTDDETLIKVADGVIEKPGFYTIPLEQKVAINVAENQRFAVIIRITAPDNSSNHEFRYAVAKNSTIVEGRSIIATNLNRTSSLNHYYDDKLDALNIRAYTTTEDYGSAYSNAQNYAVALGKLNTLDGTLEYANDVDMFKIVAPATGNYVFTSTNSTVNVKAWLYNASGTELTYNDDGNGNRNFKITYNLIAGETYYLKVSHYNQNGTGNYTVNVEALAPYNTTYPVNISAGDLLSFKFTPTTSGVYKFYSENNGTSDPYGYLYDSAGYQLAYDDDGAGSRNFSIQYYLKAGKTYYYSTKLYSSSQTGTFNVKLVSSSATTYAVTYNGNGSGATGVPTTDYKVSGVNLILSRTVPTRNGYTFLGWSTDRTATTPKYYNMGTNLTFTSNVSTPLYAVWCVRGDVDLNGTAEVGDIMALKNYIMADTVFTDYHFFAADVDGSGVVDVGDITALKSIIMAASANPAQMGVFLDSIISGRPLDASMMSSDFLLETDWNGDGVVNRADTVMIRNIISETQGNTPQAQQFLNRTANRVS